MPRQVPGTDIRIAHFNVFDRLSWGWITVTALATACSVYLLVCMSASRLTGGGWTLPHRSFWSSTSGLITDGFVFASPFTTIRKSSVDQSQAAVEEGGSMIAGV